MLTHRVSGKHGVVNASTKMPHGIAGPGDMQHLGSVSLLEVLVKNGLCSGVEHMHTGGNVHQRIRAKPVQREGCTRWPAP